MAAGIGALPTALSDSEVTKAVEPLLATIRDATDPSALWALGAGLGALPGKLSDGQARVAVEPFLAAFERISEASVLFALGAGLDAFAVKLDRRSAAAAKIAVNQAFKSTLDPQTFALYARLSVKLAKGKPADQQAGSIFHLLRHPLSAGDPSPNLFVPLEQVPGVQTKFGGDLWKAVEWAEAEQKAGRLKNLELDTPLQIN